MNVESAREMQRREVVAVIADAIEQPFNYKKLYIFWTKVSQKRFFFPFLGDYVTDLHVRAKPIKDSNIVWSLF